MSVKLPMQVGETRVCIFGTAIPQSTGCLFSDRWLLDNGPLVHGKLDGLLRFRKK